MALDTRVTWGSERSGSWPRWTHQLQPLWFPLFARVPIKAATMARPHRRRLVSCSSYIINKHSYTFHICSLFPNNVVWCRAILVKVPLHVTFYVHNETGKQRWQTCSTWNSQTGCWAALKVASLFTKFAQMKESHAKFAPGGMSANQQVKIFDMVLRSSNVCSSSK